MDDPLSNGVRIGAGEAGDRRPGEAGKRARHKVEARRQRPEAERPFGSDLWSPRSSAGKRRSKPPFRFALGHGRLLGRFADTAATEEGLRERQDEHSSGLFRFVPVLRFRARTRSPNPAPAAPGASRERFDGLERKASGKQALSGPYGYEVVKEPSQGEGASGEADGLRTVRAALALRNFRLSTSDSVAREQMFVKRGLTVTPVGPPDKGRGGGEARPPAIPGRV